MITEPGPRDWLPSAPPRSPRNSSLLSDARPRTRAIGPAVVSVIFGSAAIIFAVAPFIPDATGGRFVISTAGLTAISAGMCSIRARRGQSALGASVLSTIGIGTGAIATLVMAASWATGASLPNVVAHAVAQQPAAAQVAEPPVPAPAPQVTPSPSAASMEQTLGTLAFVMKRIHVPGTAWPAVLDVTADGAVSVPGSSEVLVRLPLGTRLGYRTSTDGSAYAVRISDSADPDRSVDYDTISGVVTPSTAADSSG